MAELTVQTVDLDGNIHLKDDRRSPIMGRSRIHFPPCSDSGGNSSSGECSCPICAEFAKDLKGAKNIITHKNNFRKLLHLQLNATKD